MKSIKAKARPGELINLRDWKKTKAAGETETDESYFAKWALTAKEGDEFGITIDRYRKFSGLGVTRPFIFRCIVTDDVREGDLAVVVNKLTQTPTHIELYVGFIKFQGCDWYTLDYDDKKYWYDPDWYRRIHSEILGRAIWVEQNDVRCPTEYPLRAELEPAAIIPFPITA